MRKRERDLKIFLNYLAGMATEIMTTIIIATISFLLVFLIVRR
ncbi:MAG: hypothetical protein QMD53_01795 [Actinomycetota bacterium]|nr:hypothetical protein [Actinomycetota bacterium]